MLRRYLKEHGITIRWLAKATGIHYDTMWKYVNYGLAYASDEIVNKIAEVLGCDRNEIV